MKILWIPHKDWPSLDGQRERSILQSWPDSDDELHVLAWQPARGYGRPFSSFKWSNFREGQITIHSRPRIPNVLGQHAIGRLASDYPRGLWANERLFRFYARHLVRTVGVEVLIYGLGNKAVGLPPFDVPVAKVFDCLDLIIYPDVETEYIRNSDLVMCTSRVLVDRVRAFAKPSAYVPNGVNTQRIAQGERERTRSTLGLQEKTVVSLIGLTASASLFFVEALALAARRVPNIVFLVVGGGDLLRPIVSRCKELNLPCVATGWVPSREIADYFAVTDLGLYPGDENAYFDAACPIKVLEYTAAQRPVVATELEELKRMAFPNVRLSRPDPASFAGAIVASLSEQAEFPDMSSFEWSAIARDVRQSLVNLVQEQHSTVASQVYV